MTNISQQSKIAETTIEGVTRYVQGDITIYRLVLESLIQHFTNCYLILDREATLVDVGFDSNKGRSDLKDCFNVVNREFKENINLEEVKNIFITHGHMDHFGMLSYPGMKGKRVYVHELDRVQITNFDDCNTSWREQMAKLTREARWNITMQRPLSFKGFDFKPGDYEIIEVRDEDRIINGYTVYHTPGHSIGQICLMVGDIIFLGDHILSAITPHQSPRYTGGAGLQTYLDSLRKVAGLEARLGLPAHQDTIYSIKARVEEMEAFHKQRMEDILEICWEAKNLGQLTREYYERYPDSVRRSSNKDEIDEDTNWVLALEEIMAHVEYLMENKNIVRIESGAGEIKYRAVA